MSFDSGNSVFHHQHPLFSPQLPWAALCMSWDICLVSLPSTNTSAPSTTQKALPCTCRALHGHTAHFASLSARKFIKQVVTYPPQSHFGSQSLQGLYCGHPWNFSGNILMEYSSQARQCGIPHFLFCCSALLWGQSRGGHQESWSSSAVRKG